MLLGSLKKFIIVQPTKGRADIQALRAIAVSAVVVYHLWPGFLRGGFVGVDVFFVISGYLMTLTLIKRVNEISAKEKIKPVQLFEFFTMFYARRARRLLPASFVVLITILLVLVVFLREDFSLLIKTSTQVFTSSIFVQNWELARTSVDYLKQSDAPSAVQHFWSLSVEEQFYMIWPAILLVGGTIAIKLKKIFRLSGVLLMIVAIFTAISLMYGIHISGINPQAAYFVTFGRLWELSLGGIIALLPLLKRNIYFTLVSWLSLALIVASTIFVDASKFTFPGSIVLLPTIATAFVIWTGSYSRFSIERLSRLRPVQFLGNTSYSLYLWHWPLIVLVPQVFNINISSNSHPWVNYVIAVLSIFIAALSYRYVENFGQNATARWSVKRIFIWSAVLVVIVSGLALGVRKYAQATSAKGVQNLKAQAFDDANKCIGAKAIIYKHICGDPFSLPKDKKDTVYAAVDNYTQTPGGRSCPYDVNRKDHINLKCVYGDKNSVRTLVLMGDSHAQAYANALDYVGHKNNIKVLNMAMVDCTAYKNGNPSREYCDQRTNWVISKVIPSADVVVIASNSQSHKKSITPAIESTFKVTAKKSIKVYMLEDFPDAGVDGGPDCLRKNLSCANKRSAALRSDDYSSKLLAAGLVEGADFTLVKTNQYFCDSDYCHSVVGGIPAYFNRDPNGNSHLTGSFSTTLGYPLAEIIK